MKKTLLAVMLVAIMLCATGCTPAESASALSLFGPELKTTDFTDVGIGVEDTKFPESTSKKLDDSVISKPDRVYNFETTTLLGNTVNQDIFRGSNITMVYIWSPECDQAVQNMQEINNIVNTLEPGMSIVSICVDTGDKFEKAKTITANFAFNTLTENPDIKFAFTSYISNIKKAPVTLFVDNNLNIVGNWIVGFPEVKQVQPTEDNPTPAVRTVANEFRDMFPVRIEQAKQVQEERAKKEAEEKTGKTEDSETTENTDSETSTSTESPAVSESANS